MQMAGFASKNRSSLHHSSEIWCHCISNWKEDIHYITISIFCHESIATHFTQVPTMAIFSLPASSGYITSSFHKIQFSSDSQSGMRQISQPLNPEGSNTCSKLTPDKFISATQRKRRKLPQQWGSQALPQCSKYTPAVFERSKLH